jgi:hypothetical protein
MLHRNAGWYGRVLILQAAGIAACNGDDTLSVPSNENVGTLEIVTTTTGAEADPDGYIVQVDAQNVGAIGASATMDTQVTAGDHTVELTGLATGCTVTGENPRSVSVVAGQIMTLSFAVSCGSDSGNLQISSSTTGPGTDDDGYSVTLDGTDRGAITPSGQDVRLIRSDLLRAPGQCRLAPHHDRHYWRGSGSQRLSAGGGQRDGAAHWRQCNRDSEQCGSR